MTSPFSWPYQVRAALQAWAERVIPADLFDVEPFEDDDDDDDL